MDVLNLLPGWPTGGGETIPPTAEATPLTGVVVSPFTDLVRTGQSVAYWGGTITLGTPLPSGILHKGYQLLSAPVAFKVTVNGVEKTITATPELVSTAIDQVVFSFEWTDGSTVSATGTITVGYTGAIDVSITVSPEDSLLLIGPIKLEIPLTPAMCVYLRHHDPKAWTAGEFIHDFTTSLDWYRYFSVADDERGLQWQFEDDQNHQNSARIHIVQSTGLATIYISRTALDFTQDATFAFTIHPLPCRPLIENHQLLTRFGKNGNPGTERMKIEPIASEVSPYIRFFGSLLPTCDPSGWAAYLADARAKDRATYGYMSPQFWLDHADSGWLAAWLNSDLPHQFGNGTTVYRECGASGPASYFRKVRFWLASFEAFLLNRVDEQFALNNFDGLYADINEETRRAVVTDAFGRSCYNFPIHKHRDIVEKLYKRCQDTSRGFVSHHRDRFHAMIHAFADYQVVGEDLTAELTAISSDYDRRRYYMHTLNQTWWRTVGNSRATGLATVLLPEFRTTGASAVPSQDGLSDMSLRFPTENAHGMARLYDLGFWKAFSHNDTSVEIYAAEDAAGLTADALFIGHWEDCPVLAASADALVSVRSFGGKLLAYVANFSHSDREIELEIPLHAAAPVLRWNGGGLGDGTRSTAFVGSVSGGGATARVAVAGDNHAIVEFPSWPLLAPSTSSQSLGGTARYRQSADELGRFL